MSSAILVLLWDRADLRPYRGGTIGREHIPRSRVLQTDTVLGGLNGESIIMGKSPPANKVRVFIVNNHELARKGLRELLEAEGMEVAGDSSSASESTVLVPVLNPAVVIIDDRLQDTSAIEACRSFRAKAPGIGCLLLTGWDDQRAARATVLAGASGYVLKQVGDSSTLLNSIYDAAAGRSSMDPGVRAKTSEGLQAAAAASWMGALTATERKVLISMAKGLTDQQIGSEMGLAPTAVARDVSVVLGKIGFGVPVTR